MQLADERAEFSRVTARRALRCCSRSSATVSAPSAICARGNGGAGWLQEAATRKNLELQQQLRQTSTGAPRMPSALASAHRVGLGVLSATSSGHSCLSGQRMAACRSGTRHHAGAARSMRPAAELEHQLRITEKHAAEKQEWERQVLPTPPRQLRCNRGCGRRMLWRTHACGARGYACVCLCLCLCACVQLDAARKDLQRISNDLTSAVCRRPLPPPAPSEPHPSAHARMRPRSPPRRASARRICVRAWSRRGGAFERGPQWSDGRTGPADQRTHSLTRRTARAGADRRGAAREGVADPPRVGEPRGLAPGRGAGTHTPPPSPPPWRARPCALSPPCLMCLKPASSPPRPTRTHARGAHGCSRRSARSSSCSRRQCGRRDRRRSLPTCVRACHSLR